MEADLFTNIAYATIRSGTPLIFVALGEMVCEKSGVLNLGQEGMMLMGAVTGFIVASTTGSLTLGILAAIIAGILMSLLFGFLALSLSANQVASGLALTLFGAGLSAFIGHGWVGKALTGITAYPIPYLSDLPFLGKVLFSQDVLVYLSFVLFGLTFWFFHRTRSGLLIRAVGESPDSAHANGTSVLGLRYFAVIFGGAMAGLAGGYLSLAYTPMWSEGMTAGRGWIALALVVFASWKSERVMLGAYLFGAASIMQLVLQNMGVSVSPNLLAMMPYVATIIVLMMMSGDESRTRRYAPASLGKPWRPNH